MWTILRVYMSDFEFDQKYPGHAHVNANDDMAEEGLFGAGPFYAYENQIGQYRDCEQYLGVFNNIFYASLKHKIFNILIIFTF